MLNHSREFRFATIVSADSHCAGKDCTVCGYDAGCGGDRPAKTEMLGLPPGNLSFERARSYALYEEHVISRGANA